MRWNELYVSECVGISWDGLEAVVMGCNGLKWVGMG